MSAETNEDVLLEKIGGDMLRIYKSVKIIKQTGGNGSIEIHFVKGHIKTNQGVYIKPGFCDDNLGQATVDQLKST